MFVTHLLNTLSEQRLGLLEADSNITRSRHIGTAATVEHRVPTVMAPTAAHSTDISVRIGHLWDVQGLILGQTWYGPQRWQPFQIHSGRTDRRNTTVVHCLNQSILDDHPIDQRKGSITRIRQLWVMCYQQESTTELFVESAK